MQALAFGPLSTAVISDRLGISKQAVLHWLLRLESEGTVEITGSSRTSPKNTWRLAAGQNERGG